MTKFGAHLSISGGYHKALENIIKIGGNCLQIFSSSPRGWSFVEILEQRALDFTSMKLKLKVDPVYFHASYLINLANEAKIGHLSKLSLISELSIAPKLHIKGSIVHLGSYIGEKTAGKYKALITHVWEILNKTPKESFFIIENAGNNKIGKDLREIAQIIKNVGDSRVKVCLDTCHLYSSGYNLSTKEKLERFLETFDSLIGLDRLELFHFNDSKDPFNSGRDRHENIGEGTIPIETFKLLMTHSKTKHLPFIIETPGFDDKGPDKKNLDILKTLIP